MRRCWRKVTPTSSNWAGAIGRLLSVELRMVTTQVGMRNPESWLFDREQAGGGILAWLACHWLDAFRYVTGEDIVRVQAEVATLGGEAIDVEDTAVLAFRTSGGAVGSLHVGYLLTLIPVIATPATISALSCAEQRVLFSIVSLADWTLRR